MCINFKTTPESPVHVLATPRQHGSADNGSILASHVKMGADRGTFKIQEDGETITVKRNMVTVWLKKPLES